MSVSTFGDVQILWKSDGSIKEVKYQSQPLLDSVTQRLNPIQLHQNGSVTLTPELDRLIIDLLNTLSSIVLGNDKRKIFFADAIFGHLYPIFNPPNPKMQSEFWKAVLKIVWGWEDGHEQVHKGTPYYFMGESFLALGDVPSAYISFFNALEEDKRNFPIIPKPLKDAPVYMTTSLVDNPINTLYPTVVIPLRAYLQKFITNYNSSTASAMTLPQVDKKLLQDVNKEDIKRFFVANFHEIYHLSSLNATRLINNDYSKLKIIDTLFNLGLIIDQLLEKKFLTGAQKNSKNMANAIYNLALNLGWTTVTVDKNPSNMLDKINPDPRKGSPDQILPALLNGTATYNGKRMDVKMSSAILAHHLRNYGGHHLEGNNIFISRYPEVLNMMMNAFFLTIESL